MTCQIQFVDREDQLEWLVDKDWPSYHLNVKDRKRDLVKWLEEAATGKVIIFGCGKLPVKGLPQYQIWQTYESIFRQNYRIYFEDQASATLFKLAWGGDA